MAKPGFKYRDRSTERFCGVGVYNPKHGGNLSILFRTLAALDCVDFLFTIGERYKPTHADTIMAAKRIPCFHYPSFQDFWRVRPVNCEVVGVENSPKAKDICDWNPPKRVVYLFGAEDEGIPLAELDHCREQIMLPCPLGISMNLSSAGSMVMYNHYLKMMRS